VQPKLAVSTPGDANERDADTVAEWVARQPAEQIGAFPAADSAPPTGPPVQPKRRSADQSGTVATPAVEQVLVSPGEPLSAEVRASMEPFLGHDLGHVRIHTDAAAAVGADTIAARAFTHGHHIAFARNQYEPASATGRQLLAHELTHVVQQASRAGGIDRAVHQIGNARILIDYGDVVGHDSPAKHQQQIERCYTALAGKPAADVRAAVAGLTESKRRWLVFALDLLTDNPLPGLDLEQAARRLIDHAPEAVVHDPLGATWREFATEAMRASGWLELALTSKLTVPGKAAQELLDELYNPTAAAGGTSSSACPANRPASHQLDEPRLRADLRPLMGGYLARQAGDFRSQGVGVQDVTQIGPVADLVKVEALRFFAPYIGHSHTRKFQQSWRYSAHLTPSTARGAIPAETKRAFLENRARARAAEVGLLDEVHYDPRCPGDELVLADILDKLAADASVQADLDTIVSWRSFTEHGPESAEVTINLQYKRSTDACDARWMAVESLCHELMHVYVSEEFVDLHRNRQLIKEGFSEILGDQLYEDIRATAGKDRVYRRQFEQGLDPDACSGAIRESRRGYPAAANAADDIRRIVGDDRFRAAYFLGRIGLAGLQPKLRVGALDDPLERQADAVAEQAVAPRPEVPPTLHTTGASMVQRQPKMPPSPQDRATVEWAKARLKVLEPLLERLRGRQFEIETERLRVLADRMALDAPDLAQKARTEREKQYWSKLNLAPVTVVVTDRAIAFHVRFHVRFEDPAMKGRFAQLGSVVQAGIDLVWKKQLEGAFAGRSFTVMPKLTLVDASMPRDQNFWLITVRKVNTGVPVTYPGCTLEQPDPEIATSVTDPTCDGGVMSIPPAHITKAGVLGHELLHLFGMVDRYLLWTEVSKTGKRTPTMIPVRETRGRQDPLGGDDATILREDLGYLFDKLGVYRRDSERQTSGLGSVEAQVLRLRRIVQLGYDPESLIRTIPPRDFNDKVIKSAQDL
jgi:hypothetical protein